MEVKHIPSQDQVAGILTKALSSSRFLKLRNKLKVENITTVSLRGSVEKNC